MDKSDLIELTIAAANKSKVCISNAYESLQYVPRNSVNSTEKPNNLPSNIDNQALTKVMQSFTENNETRRLLN